MERPDPAAISALPDPALLEAVTPKGWRRAVRNLGCPVVLAGTGWVTWRVALAVGEATAPFVGCVLAPFVFLGLGVLTSAILATATDGSRRDLRAELHRRVGQEPLPLALAALHEELAALAPDQRGWVVLLRGQRRADSFQFWVRLDLRADTSPPSGAARAVRGPKLILTLGTPKDLARWERRRETLRGSRVSELLAALDALDLGELTQNKPTPGGASRWEGAIVRLGSARNEWRFAGSLGSNPALDTLVQRALAAIDWDPTAVAPR